VAGTAVAAVEGAIDAAGRVGKDVVTVGREAARQALETTGEVSKGAVDAVKSGLQAAASVPREVVESAFKGTDEKT
jgi:hypothetical protein